MQELMQELKVDGELVLFVHGYNVTFKGAVASAGQLTFDTSREGPRSRTALAFDWACCKQDPLGGYIEDLKRSENASSKLLALLEDFAQLVSCAAPDGGGWQACPICCNALRAVTPGALLQALAWPPHTRRCVLWHAYVPCVCHVPAIVPMLQICAWHKATERVGVCYHRGSSCVACKDKIGSSWGVACAMWCV